MKAGFKEELNSEIQNDEDLLFWWDTLCAITDVDNDTSAALLPMIVGHSTIYDTPHPHNTTN